MGAYWEDRGPLVEGGEAAEVRRSPGGKWRGQSTRRATILVLLSSRRRRSPFASNRCSRPIIVRAASWAAVGRRGSVSREARAQSESGRGPRERPPHGAGVLGIANLLSHHHRACGRCPGPLRRRVVGHQRREGPQWGSETGVGAPVRWWWPGDYRQCHRRLPREGLGAQKGCHVRAWLLGQKCPPPPEQAGRIQRCPRAVPGRHVAHAAPFGAGKAVQPGWLGESHESHGRRPPAPAPAPR